MITVKPFSINDLSKYKGFFLLDKLPKNSLEVDVWVKTPTGNESVDFVDVFSMKDGSLLAAWEHPYQKLPLHNLTVFCEGIIQVLNLYTVERIWDIYDRPANAEYGTFIFCSSRSIPSADWRCDKGMYGPKPFDNENVSRVIENISDIVYYEPFLSVNGVGHIIYLESRGKTDLAIEKLNNSVVPVTGRTLQECLRLIFEWSVLAEEPFNSKEEAPTVALSFIKSLNLTQSEIDALAFLTPMQVSKFILGSETARLRDMDIPELDDSVSSILFDRMASMSLSFIVDRNPGIWDFDEVLEEEKRQLDLGISRFREYYQIPDSVLISDRSRVLEHVFVYFEKNYQYVETQLSGFDAKSRVLSLLSGSNETMVY
jgi:hypothetical protein